MNNDPYEQQSQVIENNIKASIKRAKKDGTYAMTMDNLFQITSSKGVKVPVKLYRPMFDIIASRVADNMKFVVIGGVS